MSSSPRRLLILGGTGEGLALGRALANRNDFAPIYSVAGRTSAPILPPIPSRTGGFGGTEGLVEYLGTERIDLIIDATHPFAAQMSRHAADAARRTGIPLLALRRPAWVPGRGDHWTDVPTMEAAVASLGGDRKAVFLTIGQRDLAPFQWAPQHRYVIRSVEAPPISVLPPDHRILTQRGPFSLDDERALLTKHAIDVLVTKNSGGAATSAKLVAARERKIPVIMVARPDMPVGTPQAPDVGSVLAWLDGTHRVTSGTDRGV